MYKGNELLFTLFVLVLRTITRVHHSSRESITPTLELALKHTVRTTSHCSRLCKG